ncbi:MAG: mitochondrial fission ELM1 family protein [Parvularculaceae bacterium]|nr:mitochondrial fission ELM1 family protein [Parvularculaceae bacterium]
MVTDGRAGIEAQALGLAEAIGRVRPVDIEVKRIALRAPWRYLPRQLIGDGFAKLAADSAPLAPTYPDLRPDLWPDIWIGCGRACVPLTIGVKRKSPRTFTVQVQDPRAPAALFDIVAPPAHDRLAGANVIPIIGAPNRIDRTALTGSPNENRTGGDNVAVLVGGSSGAFRFSDDDARRLAAQLRALADRGAQLWVTTSRRTPQAVAALLQASLGDVATKFWRADADAPGDNPYPKMLAVADHVIVTEDSVNMASEAAMTGKPVHVFALSRRRFGNAQKFDRFHAQLRKAGAARPFTGALENWRYEPVDETARLAGEIVKRWRAAQ